jgi:excisionase family DNA binding protein
MNPEPTPLLLDSNAAAEFVGIGVGTLRSWVQEGSLPFIRAGRGGKKMFDPRDLRKHVERLKEIVQ